MLTEREVLQAIDECMEEPMTGNKRSVLADLFIIHDHLFGEPIRATEPPQMPMPMQSYSAPQTLEQVEIYVETNGDSEFLKAVNDKKADRAWRLMNELVEAVRILHPNMYTSFIDKVLDL